MPSSVLAIRARARAFSICGAIVAIFAVVAGQDVVDAFFPPRGATKLLRRTVRRGARKERSGVIRPSFKDGVMSLAVDGIVDAMGNVERADIIMTGNSESSNAATVAAVTASRSKRDAFRVGRFADIAADILDGSSLPSRSHSGNATWLNLKGKMTFQSATIYEAASARAVDGSENNTWSRRSCMCAKGHPAFWEIDLGNNYSVTHISVLRENANPDFINPFSVTVDGKKCIDSESFPKLIFQHEFKCDAVGRRVRLSRPLGKQLTMCEVKVRVKSTWKQISATRICEGYFAQGRAEQRIHKNLNMIECSLDFCQISCQRETDCRSVDWFAATCICQLYRSACPANQTTHGHNEGSSYELEFES
eukprot:TRINITY_DN14352_c0_g1_i1.p1 TRINITY_DN14352_c0_g1~~TRINITY_DN14352_c0_g1_i1.p1  ORF type:complete len:364 (-),score=43.30 TRINITY_DN14352_c0_g1_i1:18-1109(-)